MYCTESCTLIYVYLCTIFIYLMLKNHGFSGEDFPIPNQSIESTRNVDHFIDQRNRWIGWVFGTSENRKPFRMSHEDHGSLLFISSTEFVFVHGILWRFFAHRLVYRHIYTYYLDTLIRLQFNEPCDDGQNSETESHQSHQSWPQLWILYGFMITFPYVMIMISLTPWFVLDILGPSAIEFHKGRNINSPPHPSN